MKEDEAPDDLMQALMDSIDKARWKGPFYNHVIMGDGTYARLTPHGCVNQIREADGHLSCNHGDEHPCNRPGHVTVTRYVIEPITVDEFKGHRGGIVTERLSDDALNALATKAREAIRERNEALTLDAQFAIAFDDSSEWHQFARAADPQTVASLVDEVLQARARETQWFICTERLRTPWCGKKIMGPFASKDAALDARTKLEALNAPTTYWVDSEPAEQSQ